MTNLETLLLAMLGNKGGGGEGGTTNYNELDNRPQVNGITLTGNKDSEDLNLVDINMIGVSYGIAALDKEGKVPESQLPPYPNYDDEIQNINKALEGKAEQSSVSALEEKVNKKANKTFIEDVTSETHVVTVPENVAGFAAIKMIGGKTVKSKNLLDYKAVVRYSVQGKVSEGFSLRVGTTALTYLLKLKPNTTYTLSKSKAVGDRFRIILSAEQLSVGTSVAGTQPYFYNDSEIHTETFTTDSTNVYCAIAFDTSLSLSPSDCEEMLEEGETATEYEPYFEGLHSAPVESAAIISGDNTVNENENFFNDGHIDTDTTRSRSNALPVDVVSDTVIATVKSKSEKAIDCSFVAYKGTTKMVDTGWNANQVNYTLTNRDFDFAGIAIRYHDNSTIIKDDIILSLNCGKRNQISLVDIVKSLPDYGVEGNYVDFEGMKYHHINKINSDSSDVEPLTTPEVIDLSDILTPFAVEPKGTIKFINKHNLDVPNTILYQKEVL